jgi:hypothetical protein
MKDTKSQALTSPVQKLLLDNILRPGLLSVYLHYSELLRLADRPAQLDCNPVTYLALQGIKSVA